MYAAFLSLLLVVTEAPDTLVVCPPEHRAALAPWQEFREEQGHCIRVIDPPASAAALQQIVRQAAATGQLKTVVLIGDVATDDEARDARAKQRIPTHHVRAKINTRWGSPPTIATDVPYADVDGDNSPDIAIGRIPADSADELSQIVRKIILYERQSEDGAWQRRLDLVAGVGGFGAVPDALIEAAGRQVFIQAVPAGYELRHTSVAAAKAASEDICTTARGRLNEGSLAWIYMGHGRPTELDFVASTAGLVPLLSVNDLAQIHCAAESPLAVMVACYTGAFDARSECLAEELALREHGPVAVIAATRVTMPYGNTVFGYELLRACFRDRPATLGEIVRLAQCRTLTADSADTFRPSLDSLAQGLSPSPVDLPAERREHVLMYHLLGDPLLRLRLSSEEPTVARPGVPPLIGTALGD